MDVATEIENFVLDDDSEVMCDHVECEHNNHGWCKHYFLECEEE